MRVKGWSSLGQRIRLFNYSPRLKNDKILKEVYWSVERFKNDLWKLNSVPLELSISPGVFSVAVMLWRLKCQGCIRDLEILETPVVVKVESLSEMSPERMFVLGDRKISMKMVIRCHWIVKQVDHEKNKRRIILFRKDFPTRKKLRSMQRKLGTGWEWTQKIKGKISASPVKNLNLLKYF